MSLFKGYNQKVGVMVSYTEVCEADAMYETGNFYYNYDDMFVPIRVINS